MANGKLAQLKTIARREGWLKYVRTENDEIALLEGCRVDLQRGRHAADFFPRFLRHTQGEWAGKPFDLPPYQDDILVSVFGWVNADGLRRFRRAYIWTPKKWGKSTLAAGIAIYGLGGLNEPGAKIFCLANSQEQVADSIFDECANMLDLAIENDPDLGDEFRTIRSTRRILRGHAAYIRALSGEHKTSEGKNAFMWFIDEIHKFDERGRLLRESFRYAGRTRREPMEVITSTVGDDEAGIGKEEWDDCKKILDGPSKGGIQDLKTFVYIAAADPKDDWTSPATWRKANPQIGVTFDEGVVRAECEEAIAKPRLVNVFKRYSLNIWTTTDEIWLRMDKWAACARKIDPAELVGVPCCGAIDASDTTDLSAFCIVFNHGEGVYSILPWFWLPLGDIVECEHRDRMEYRRLAESGLIELTDGNTIDRRYIEKRVVEECERYNVHEIAYDRRYMQDTAQRLQDDHGLTVFEYPQTIMEFTGPCKHLEAMVIDEKFRHPNHPILNRMAAQTTVYRDANDNIRPIKSDRHKRRKRIDGIVAGLMALKRAALMQDVSGFDADYEMPAVQL